MVYVDFFYSVFWSFALFLLTGRQKVQLEIDSIYATGANELDPVCTVAKSQELALPPSDTERARPFKRARKMQLFPGFSRFCSHTRKITIPLESL
jgi:hypothetical protein